MPVEYTRDGRLKLAKLTAGELAVIDAFLDHCRDGIRRQIRHAKAAQEHTKLDTNLAAQERYVNHAERFLAWCFAMLANMPNYRQPTKEDENGGSMGRQSEQSASG